MPLVEQDFLLLPGFCRDCVAQSLVFCVVFCRSLLDQLSLSTIALSVLPPFTAFDYLFSFYKLFLISLHIYLVATLCLDTFLLSDFERLTSFTTRSILQGFD